MTGSKSNAPDWEDSPDVDIALDELEDATPRAATLLAGALLDDLLGRLLLRALPNDSVANLGPMELDYYAKCQWAYRLGLISSMEFRDLRQIGKIRNKFAHTWSPHIGFDASPVSDWVRGLEAPRTKLPNAASAGKRLIPRGNVADYAGQSNHHWWLTAVQYMLIRLLIRIERVVKVVPVDSP